MNKKRTTLNCPNCGRFMSVTHRRKDGCRMLSCINCDVDIGEETEEWFAALKMQGLV